jgi:ABC-type dipeptide/oligopeptide/nickel transport system permease component
MLRYTIRRLLFGLVVILTVTFAVFALTGPVLTWRLHIDLARAYAGKNPSPEQVDQASKLLGLDQPFYVQYLIALRRLALGPSADEKARLCPGSTDAECSKLIGHFGRSFLKARSVDSILADRAGATISLALVAAVMWLTVGVAVGVLSAIRPRSLFDRTATGIVLIGQALPVYYFGLLALYFFTFKVRVFPQGGYIPFSASDPWPWFSHLLLPGMVLALSFAAIYARMTRANMLGALSEDYVRTARAKGASERRVLMRHALRNALLPIVTIFGLDLGTLLGGAILTEYTFGISGLGRLTVESARSFDIPLIAGVVLFAAIAIVIANIVVDLLYAVIDPRIRLA